MRIVLERKKKAESAAGRIGGRQVVLCTPAIDGQTTQPIAPRAVRGGVFIKIDKQHNETNEDRD